MNSLLASSSQDVYSHPNTSQHDGKCVGREFRTKHQLQCEYMTMLSFQHPSQGYRRVWCNRRPWSLTSWFYHRFASSFMICWEVLYEVIPEIQSKCDKSVDFSAVPKMLIMPGSGLVTKTLTLTVYNLVKRHTNMNKQNQSFQTVVNAMKKTTAKI